MSAEHLRCCGRLVVPGDETTRLATLSLRDGRILLESADGQESLIPSAIRIQPAGSSSLRRILLPDGSILETPDDEGVDALAARLNLHPVGSALNASKAAVQGWRFARLALPLLLMLGIGAVTLPHAIEWMADTLVEMIGPDSEATIGQMALLEADTTLLQPSWLDTVEQDPAHRVFRELVQVAALPDTNPRLVLRHGGPKVGANAMALPGGTVILTDELLAVVKDDEDALASVLAHELGHIAKHHGLRLFFRATPTVMAFYWLQRDDRQLGRNAVGLVELLIDNAYGQRFEMEADAYSASLVQRAGRSPEGLLRALTALSAADHGSTSKPMQYLRNHPPLADRIAQYDAMMSSAHNPGR